MPVRIGNTLGRAAAKSNEAEQPLETIAAPAATSPSTPVPAEPKRARKKPARKSNRKLGPIGDHLVGDRKPDPRYQWQPGQSGNPRGPKRKEKEREKTLGMMVREAFFAPGGLLPDGSTITMIEVLLRGLVRDAIKDTSSPKKRSEALSIALRYLPMQEVGTDEAPPLTEDEIALFRELQGLRNA